MSRSFGPPLLLGPVLLASAAVTALLAVSAQTTPAAPAAVSAGQVMVLPDAGPLTSRARLVSSRPADLSRVRPGDVGCSFTAASGQQRSVFVTVPVPGSTARAVAGRTTHPLLELARIGTGTRMVCTGAALERYGPVYLVPDDSALTTGLILLGAGSLLLALAGGVAVLIGLRQRAGRRRVRRPTEA